MRKLFSMLILALASAPAFAVAQVPEPEVLSLLAVGVAGALIARRKK